ncbi:MAG: Eco57I restriction-modification methylase domain-containing protein, partial [Deltaproteobacteria bacterium]|nr:Eco57I restriction-modification methylase domain-containing protein [Deltaproteobacteria bacterium]
RLLRMLLLKELESIGYSSDSSKKIAKFDPYDQNASADFFDPEWMFGVISGFDIVIGNPPYIFARNSAQKGLSKEDKRYFYYNYELAKYQVNLYPLFIEKSTQILSNDGLLAFITPNNWLTINTNGSLREFVLKKSNVIIVNFYAQVFESAAVDSAVVIFTNNKSYQAVSLYEYTDELHFIKNVETYYFLKQRDFVINIETFKIDGIPAILDNIEKCSVTLDELADVKAGLKAYEISKGTPLQTKAMKDKRVYHSKIKLGSDYYKYLDGKDVCRYYCSWSGEYLKYGANLAAPRKDFALFSSERIIVRQIPKKPPYCIHACTIGDTYLNDLNSMNVINLKESPELLLGIINSRVISFWFIHKFGKLQRGTFPQFKIKELAMFPIPKYRTIYKDEIIRLVKEIVDKKLLNHDADTMELDLQIDSMVYKLYNLQPEEIKIIEEDLKRYM